MGSLNPGGYRRFGAMTLADRYRRFARLEARGKSPLYEQLALEVADDPAVQAVLARVAPAKQQPNLLFATVSFLGGVQPSSGAFRAFVLEHADAAVGPVRPTVGGAADADRSGLPAIRGRRRPRRRARVRLGVRNRRTVRSLGESSGRDIRGDEAEGDHGAGPVGLDEERSGLAIVAGGMDSLRHHLVRSG